MFVELPRPKREKLERPVKDLVNVLLNVRLSNGGYVKLWPKNVKSAIK